MDERGMNVECIDDLLDKMMKSWMKGGWMKM
jgi:hypothetical protein